MSLLFNFSILLSDIWYLLFLLIIFPSPKKNASILYLLVVKYQICCNKIDFIIQFHQNVQCCSLLKSAGVWLEQFDFLCMNPPIQIKSVSVTHAIITISGPDYFDGKHLLERLQKIRDPWKWISISRIKDGSIGSAVNVNMYFIHGRCRTKRY